MANMRNAIWGQTSNDHKHTKTMWANSAKISLKKNGYLFLQATCLACG